CAQSLRSVDRAELQDLLELPGAGARSLRAGESRYGQEKEEREHPAHGSLAVSGHGSSRDGFLRGNARDVTRPPVRLLSSGPTPAPPKRTPRARRPPRPKT